MREVKESLDEVKFVIGFREVIEGTEGEGEFFMFIAAAGGEHSDWDVGGKGRGFDASEEAEAIESGHFDIADNGMR